MANGKNSKAETKAAGMQAELVADVVATVQDGDMMGALFAAGLTGVKLVSDQGEWPILHPSTVANLIVLVTDADMGMDQGARWLALK
jgi:hypothetical protein